MSNHATAKLLVIWEDEVRLAARCLRGWAELDRDNTPSDEQARVIMAAIHACWAAIGDADNDTTLVLASKGSAISAEAEAGDAAGELAP